MGKLDQITKDELAVAVAGSDNIRQTLLALGCTDCSYNRKIIKSRILHENISVSHFHSHSALTKNTPRQLTPDQIFIKSLDMPQTTVRKAFRRGNYAPYKCAICNRPPEWEGSPLTLILDHVDGDNSNHVLGNLRWVCPNCDSQLLTYRGRNKKRIDSPFYSHTTPAFCSDCSTEIGAGHVRCRSCENKRRQRALHDPALPRVQQEKISWPNNTVLGWMVSNFNLVSLGRHLGVSDNAIKKRCVARGIKIPKTRRPPYSGETPPHFHD